MLPLVKYDPFEVMFGRFNRELSEAFGPFTWTESTLGDDENITSDNKNIYLHWAIPGFKREDVKVFVENNILVVDACLQSDDASKNRGYFAKQFTKKFTLSERHDIKKIESKLENGILSVTIPFKSRENKEENKFPIEVK